MNADELSVWRNAVNEHMEMVDTIMADRQSLKNLIENHLNQFFEWYGVEYNRDMSVITLKFAPDVSPIIENDELAELGMDWIIRADYDGSANRIVVIELYPFGFVEG